MPGEVYDAAVDRFRTPFGPLPRGRPLLHAWALEVPHPSAARGALRVRAPLPADMVAVVARLWPQLATDDPASWPRVPLEEVAAADATDKVAAPAQRQDAPGAKKMKAAKAAAEDGCPLRPPKVSKRSLDPESAGGSKKRKQ